MSKRIQIMWRSRPVIELTRDELIAVVERLTLALEDQLNRDAPRKPENRESR